MAGVGILTDASAHFFTTPFPGSERVHMLPLPISWEGRHHLPPSSTLTAALPPSLIGQTPPKLLLPPTKDILTRLRELRAHYDGLLLLPMGSSLSDLFQRFADAAAALSHAYPIYVVDTQAVGVALGQIVREAAALAASGADIFTTLSHIRGIVHRVYTALCIRSLTYLQHNGFLEPSQAIIGEMMNIYPFFVLEEGRLAPLQKGRSSRHLLDLMEEFASEFARPEHIIITHHPYYCRREAYNLRDRLMRNETSALVRVTEADTVSAVLFGPRTLALSILTN